VACETLLQMESSSLGDDGPGPLGGATGA